MNDTASPMELAANAGDSLAQAMLIKAAKTSVQSLLFEVKQYTAAEAKKWATDHGYKSDSVDTTDQYHRLRQFPPGNCQQNSERTITFGKGIKAVICKKKGETSMDEENAKALDELRRFYEADAAKAGSRLYVDKRGIITVERFFSGVVKDVSDAEATIVHFISTPRIDPVHDVMNPYGMNGEALEKNKGVFYNHRWHGPGDTPIGKNLWTKPTRDGVLAKTQYAVNESAFAADVYKLASGGFLNSYSIGFTPKKWEFTTVGDLKKVTDGKYDIPNTGDFDKATNVMVHHGWDCHEYSQVGVPMNMDAVQAGKAMGVLQSDFAKDLFGALFQFKREHLEVPETKDKGGAPEETKGALPYEKHELAQEGAAWSAAAEVRKADVEDLKKMCAWYDSSAPDVKGSYKLPHHTSGAYKTVWRGVAAAMGALLGARGGINIPTGDKKAVYSHLAKHYKDFDKEPPEFKQYSEEELKAMFPEVYADESLELAMTPEQIAEIVRKEIGECAAGMKCNIEAIEAKLGKVLGWIGFDEKQDPDPESVPEPEPKDAHGGAHCKGCTDKAECKGAHCKSCDVKGDKAECAGNHCKSCTAKEKHEAVHCSGCTAEQKISAETSGGNGKMTEYDPSSLFQTIAAGEVSRTKGRISN